MMAICHLVQGHTRSNYQTHMQLPIIVNSSNFGRIVPFLMYWCVKLYKIASFPHPSLFELTPPLRGNRQHFLVETYPAKTREMGLLYGENCMILTSTVFDWTTLCDRRTDKYYV